MADLVAPAAVAEGIELPTPCSAQLAWSLAQTFGPATLAVIHYGSQARCSDAIAVTARVPGQATPVKCAVYSTAHFLEATSTSARDHFAHARLFQCVHLAWVRDALARNIVMRALIATRTRTFEWGRPYLPEVFGVEGYLRALLETSFGAEIRPEAADRVNLLLDAQLPLLRAAYSALLDALTAAGELQRVTTGYRLTRPVSPQDRRRVGRYFRRSKRRSTLRWAKHVVLYEDWLTYVVRKLERRSGMRVELTGREQRWPLIFLWPRAIRFLLTRPQRGRR